MNRILIIEDDESTVIIIKKMLKGSIYNLLHCKDGKNILENVREIRPDLILLDINLPGVSGFDICDTLKQSSDCSEIPIIFITGLGNSENILKGFEKGAIDYIVKPFSVNELKARIKTHVDLFNLQKTCKQERVDLLKKYEAIVENIPQKIFIKDLDSIYISCNENYCNDLHISPDQIEGKNDFDFYSDDLALKYQEDDKYVIDNKIEINVIEKYEQDGNRTWVHTIKKPVFDKNGNMYGIIGLFNDVTKQKEMEQTIDKLESLSIKDPLTSIYNRRYFQEIVTIEFKRANRTKLPLSLLIIDIDFFKSINDIYGHQHGDECLKSVARTIDLMLKRPADMCFRFGGEEFVALLPETAKVGAHKVAEDIRMAIENLNIENKGSKISDYLTISIGVAEKNTDSVETVEELLKIADDNLYAAKNQGRNRVV